MARSPSQAGKNTAPVRASRTARSAASTALAQARTADVRTRDSVPVGSTVGASEVWQARIARDLAEQLRADAEVLGITGRTDIVRAALSLLHKQAAQERMAQSVVEFYGDSTPPLPLGVTPGHDGT